ncbi:Elongated TPR repeat-containing domain protein [Moelleriella libera RCEF 2490]|uniref:Elongated TPR repeat-containing domain protein n=1 Tax=Moelleriella libera RCEF 2490 TaxID=1081109 RepID=A0A166VF24_9HYPO|nr:Elongated TPR repeat-containing domain protein [Moelleriella libera RCEF 2490]
MTDSSDSAVLPSGDDSQAATATDPEEPMKFTPEEEKSLIQESNAIKAEANSLYATKDYENALSRYEDALWTCPKYLHFERAVLQSNMAACHLPLQQWKDAIKIATKALDSLDALLTKPTQGEAKEAESKSSTSEIEKSVDRDPQEGVEEEIISSGAERAAAAVVPEQPTDEEEAAAAAAAKRAADIQRIRVKALLRRARARSEAGGWQNLAGAEEDYKMLKEMPGVGAADMKTVRSQLATLPPRTKAAQEKEMSEMWGKLKTLGDGILKPFGLSTDNFQMVKDEKSGGYSMNFTSGADSSKSST